MLFLRYMTGSIYKKVACQVLAAAFLFHRLRVSKSPAGHEMHPYKKSDSGLVCEGFGIAVYGDGVMAVALRIYVTIGVLNGDGISFFIGDCAFAGEGA